MTDVPLSSGAQTWPEAGVGSRPVTVARREAAFKRFFATAGFVLDSTRRRRSGRIFLWMIVIALAGAGVWMLAYPTITSFWANRLQNGLKKEFSALQPGGFQQGSFKDGQALTRLRIPTLKVDVIVVEGWTGNALRAGAGHRPGTALPGEQVGNVAIAGHRTGFGEPFRHINDLKPGDKIFMDTPLGEFEYRVVPPFDRHDNPWITTPEDMQVADNGNSPSYAALTLITCDPPHTSRDRLIVRARLITGVVDPDRTGNGSA